MKKTIQLIALALLTCVQLAPANDAPIAALTAADDARIAAMKSPNKEALTALFSDDLHYAHSNGIIDTKTSFIEVLTSGTTKYLAYDHQQRQFTFPAPGIALMSGQTRIQAETAKGQVDSILSYLAVWRLEEGQWRFLAWQSCRLPPANP